MGDLASNPIAGVASDTLGQQHEHQFEVLTLALDHWSQIIKRLLVDVCTAFGNLPDVIQKTCHTYVHDFLDMA